jgi:hypothetical protein
VRACVVQRKEEKRKFTTLMGTKFCFGFLVQKMFKIIKGYLLNYFLSNVFFKIIFLFFKNAKRSQILKHKSCNFGCIFKIVKEEI